MSDSPYTGPDPEMLRQLKGMLPSYAAGFLEKKIGKPNGKIIPLEQPLKPTKYCSCCALMFEHKREFEGELEAGVCVACKKRLDQGWTCFVSDDRYAFGKAESLKDMAGKIVMVRKATMDELQKQFKSQKKGGSEGNAA